MNMMRSFLSPILCATAGFAFSSCGLISDSGPLKGSIEDMEGEYRVIQVKSVLDIPDKGRKYGRSSAPPSVKGQAYSDKIRVRDSLMILITDVSENSPFFSQQAFSVGPIEVPSTGLVGVPYAGEVEVLDLSLSEAAQKLEEKLDKIAPEAEVIVNRTGRLPRTANVLGEVQSPGTVALERAGLTSHDLLASAGGPKESEHLFFYTLRRGSKEYQFDYLGFRRNPFPVEEGDLLTVSRDATNRFHVMGAINRPASVAFPLPSPTLADALGSATGLDERRSDASGVFVFRKGSPNMVYLFDLKEPSTMGLVQRFPIQGEDIIYITEAPLVRWNRMLNLILPNTAFMGANQALRFNNLN